MLAVLFPLFLVSAMTFLERRPLAVLAAGLILMAALAASMAHAETPERRFDAASWPDQLSVAAAKAVRAD